MKSSTEILEYAQANGLGGLLRAVGRRARSFVWEIKTNYLLDKDLTGEIPEIQPRIPLTFREVSEDDLPALLSMAEEGKEAVFNERLRIGRVGFMALDGDRIIHYSWLSFDDEEETDLGLLVPVGPGEGYIFDGYTDPDYRGQRIYPAMLSRQLRYIKQRGCHDALIMIGVDNIPSLRSADRAGFVKRSRFTVAQILGRKLPAIKRGA